MLKRVNVQIFINQCQYSVIRKQGLQYEPPMKVIISEPSHISITMSTLRLREHFYKRKLTNITIVVVDYTCGIICFFFVR